MINWRTYGDVSYETWHDTIRDVGGPVELASKSSWESARPHSALMLAMAGRECRWGTTENLNTLANRNVLNLKMPLMPDGTRKPGFMAFDAWRYGVAAAVMRITSDSYGKGVYKDTITLLDLISVFAPSSENDVAGYVAFIEDRFREWGVTGKETEMPEKMPTIPVIWSPIPKGAPNNPSGVLLEGPLIIVWHENGNPSSDADDEARFLMNGGGPSRVSYTFAVDHEKAFQFFACNELCWHAADGCDNPATDRGCFRGVPIEHCQDRDPAKWQATLRNGAILSAMIISGHPSIHFGGREGDFSADRIETHQAVSDTKKRCPEWMLNAGIVDDQIRRVRALLAGDAGNPDYAEPRTPPEWNGKDVEAYGETFRALRRIVTAKKDTHRLRVFDVKGPRVGPDIPKGTEFEVLYQVKTAKGTFYVTPYGTVVSAGNITPSMTLRDR